MTRLSRPAFLAGMFLICAHAGVILLFGASPPGPLLSDLIQLVLGTITAVACFRSARQSGPFGKMFFHLAGVGFTIWCIGQIFGTYYGDILGIQTQPLWGIDLIFTAWPAPLVMCMFLDTEGEPEGFDWQRMLDFGQVGIVFLLLFFFFSSVSTNGSAASSFRLSAVTDGLVTIGFLVRASSSRYEPAGKLFQGLAYFRMAAFLTDLYFVVGFRDVQNGTSFDLVWSVPWLVPIAMTVVWDGDQDKNPPKESEFRERRLLLTQLLPLIFPLLVLLMAAEVAQGQLVVAAIAVLASLSISYSRLILTSREQRKSARALRQQHGLLQSIIEGTTESIFVKDLQGRFIMINSAGARFLDSTIEDVVGKDIRAFATVGTAQAIMTDDRHVLESGKTKTYKESGQFGGTKRIFLSTKGPYRDGLGNVVGLVGSSVDITDRERDAEILAESEERFRTIFDGSPIGIAIAGMDGVVLAMNGAYRRILELGPEDSINGQIFDELTHPDDKGADALRYQELVNSVRAHDRLEKRYLLPSKKVVWTDLNLFLLRDREGEARYVIGMANDITERRMLEEQLRQAQRMETIGTLAGGVAHDFNNLLTVIKGYCNLMMDGLEGQDLLRAQMEHIDRATEQAASLTRQLLAFSRRQVLQPKVFNVNELVKNADKMLRRLIGENIEIVTVTSSSLGAVKADPGQIESVIMNLAVNARDAMPNGGTLTLETANIELDATYAQQHFGAKPGRYVMLAVSDTGMGMDKATLLHIFEPFFTTKEVGKGTGLGLSTVYGIVKQSEGYIWAYSEPGKGATFKTYLPRVDEPVEIVDIAPKATVATTGSETILLAEDDPQVRELTREVLEASGYRVLATDKSLDVPALCRAHAGTIHLLVTDVVMPGLSGSELAATIVAERPGIKVLYMSGYTDNAVLHHGIPGEEAFFLQKPFTPSRLTALVREILDQQTK